MVENQFEVAETGVRCKVCPAFTGSAGYEEGMAILSMLRGSFTTAKAAGEWLLDTDGCEVHYEDFGGALLLAFPKLKGIPGMPAVTLGSSLVKKPGKELSGALQFVFYKPGFRMNDCLAFGGIESRTLLVCNEADMAQGKLIGHVSAMNVSRRGISRWRLLRWYDNSRSDTPQILSVVPTGMSQVELDKGQPGLQINLKILESTRQDYEKSSKPVVKPVTLLFRRKGQRFFVTKDTQGQLEEISVLIRKMLD